MLTRAHVDPERAELDREVLRWMREPEWRRDDARFESLALRLFAWQFEHCAPYRRFCEGRGVTPRSARDPGEIPPVPTGAFKEVALTSFPIANARHCFRTSGTSIRARGALHLDTLELYEASLLPSFRRHVLPDLPRGARARIAVLAPSADDVPDSSLSHMFAVVLRELGDTASGWFVHGGELDADALLRALDAACADATPVAVCGTAFAFVHALDALSRRGRALSLPTGSRMLETGGFKGRSRVLTRDELYGEIDSRLGIPAARIVNQYGMTELGSQFYDSVLADPGAPRRKLAPPWTRIRIVDPLRGELRPEGRQGAIVVQDLANTGSVFAVQTADLGVAHGDGFEVIGRDPGAEERGCSIALDELLGGAA
ncbi:MAG TPA: long-chain fatty acid--CoA ligase [Myxococcota bacterium]|nr:long-chain fatty acid--CoA ligase [Myxococcota bacterium]